MIKHFFLSINFRLHRIYFRFGFTKMMRFYNQHIWIYYNSLLKVSELNFNQLFNFLPRFLLGKMIIY